MYASIRVGTTEENVEDLATRYAVTSSDFNPVLKSPKGHYILSTDDRQYAVTFSEGPFIIDANCMVHVVGPHSREVRRIMRDVTDSLDLRLEVDPATARIIARDLLPGLTILEDPGDVS